MTLNHEFLSSFKSQYDKDRAKLETYTLKVCPKEKRIARPILTKYEFASLFGTRLMELNRGAPPLIDLKELNIEHLNYRDQNNVIAETEIKRKVLPHKIEKPVHHGKEGILYEIWTLDELEIPKL